MAELNEFGEQIGITTADRRREKRWPSRQLAVVIILLSGKSLEAQTVDMSTAGMRIRLREPLAVGEKVRVECRSLAVSGEVRWCTQLEDDYYNAGIQVTVWEET